MYSEISTAFGCFIIHVVESFNNSPCIQFNSNEFTYSIHKKVCILFFTMFLFSIENYQMIIMQLSMCASTTSKHKYLGL